MPIYKAYGREDWTFHPKGEKKKIQFAGFNQTVAKQTQHICGSHLQFWPLKLSTAHPAG